MTILQKLVLAWKGRNVLSTLAQAGKGWKTVHFWVTLLGSLASYAAALKEIMPPEWALIITTVLTASYNIMRGMDKAVDDKTVKPWYQTTEGWLGVGAQIQNAMLSIQSGGVRIDHMAEANVVLTTIMKLAGDLSHIEPTDLKAGVASEPQKA